MAKIFLKKNKRKDILNNIYFMEKEYSKEYYKANKEIMDNRSKEWKIKNKEAWNAYQREWKRKRYIKKLKEDGNKETA